MNIDRNLLKSYATTEPAGAPPLPPDNRRPVAGDFRPPSRPTSDDIAPPAPAPRPQQHQTSPQPVAPSQPKGDTNISINITMPKLKKPVLPDWDYKKIRKWAIIAVSLIVASFVIHAVIVGIINFRKDQAAKHRIDMIDQRNTPSFKPLLPNQKVAKGAKYDPRRDSYSFNDTFKGLAVIVSQQRLPNGSTPDTIAKIAKSMNATTPIPANGGTAYLANNPAGAQTVVMGTGSLLVFVQSSFAHSAADWKSYLDTLQS